MGFQFEFNKTYLVDVLVFLFILLFVYASVSKLLDFETFETQLAQSPLLSAYAKPVAIGVPGIELLIALLLMIKPFRLFGLFSFFCLMVMFTTYIIIILNFTDFVPCSCGGVLEDMGWTEHLVFNIGFILLTGFCIYLLKNQSQHVLLLLSTLIILSSAVVTLLYVSSEKQMKRNNAFVRRYVPHPVEKIGTYELKFNSYYISGLTEDYVYLGNMTTPLQLLRLNTQLTEIDTIKVSISKLDLPYKRVRTQIIPPYFYVGDGSVPILFRGLISDWRADIYSYGDGYFMQFVPIDSTKVAITTISTLNNETTIGYIENVYDKVKVKLKPKIIKKQIDSRFDSDGMMLFNQKHSQLIYTYYYRNTFEVTDKSIDFKYTGKTIDTISQAIIDVAHYSRSNSYKLGAKTIVVNKQTATHGNYLYIHSDRLGRYEDEGILSSAGIVDVYDIRDGSYVFSFYLYHQKDKKLSQIYVYNNLLVAIVDDQLWLYRLKRDYFKALP